MTARKEIRPLEGLRVIELAGLGPAPFAGMLLAQMGADITLIHRGVAPLFEQELADKRTVELDLKTEPGVSELLDKLKDADVLIEGFRPGVMERLGLGPDECMQRQPKLIYARMTGYGQTGPHAQEAGHDLNYIGLSGALAALAPEGEKPPIPLNLVGDYGGGALYLLGGILAGLYQVQRTGQGLVIDCAIVEGSASLCTPFFVPEAAESWLPILRGDCPYYQLYACADAKYISFAPLEPQFYENALSLLGVGDDELLQQREDRSLWPKQTVRLAEIFRGRSRDEWTALAAGKDSCIAPVLALHEAAPARPTPRFYR